MRGVVVCVFRQNPLLASSIKLLPLRIQRRIHPRCGGRYPRAMAQTALAIWTAVRQGIQVVLTTHSLEFVDFLISEADDSELEKLGMFRLRLINGVLGYTAATGAEMEFARANIAEDLR